MKAIIISVILVLISIEGNAQQTSTVELNTRKYPKECHVALKASMFSTPEHQALFHLRDNARASRERARATTTAIREFTRKFGIKPSKINSEDQPDDFVQAIDSAIFKSIQSFVESVRIRRNTLNQGTYFSLSANNSDGLVEFRIEPWSDLSHYSYSTREANFSHSLRIRVRAPVVANEQGEEFALKNQMNDDWESGLFERARQLRSVGDKSMDYPRVTEENFSTPDGIEAHHGFQFEFDLRSDHLESDIEVVRVFVYLLTEQVIRQLVGNSQTALL